MIASSASVLAAPLSAPASAASAMTASVYPNSGLTDRQRVVVRWSGFPAMKAAGIFICEKGAVDKSRCANTVVTADRLSDVVSTFAVTGPDGTGSESVMVALTDASHGLAGHDDIQCTPASSCEIIVSPSFTSFADAVRTTISFAAPGTCPDKPGLLHFIGAGADSAAAALGAWTGRMCNAPMNVSVGYASASDVQGRYDYQCRRVDFAGIESKPDWESDAASCPAAGTGQPARRLAPMTLSATVIAFNMADQQYSYLPRLDRLVLTPELLAEIFTGTLTNGRDPRITALNPGVQLPANIKAIARADQSAINYRLTRFLATYAPKAYKAGGPVFAGGPTDSLAAVAGLDLRTGDGTLARALVSPDPDPRQSSYGYLGVMDSSTAAKNGLSTVTIRIGSGKQARELDATPEAIARSVAGVKADRYGYFNLPAKPKDPKAWPMSVLSYALAPGSLAEPAQLAAASLALGFILDRAHGQAPSILPPGYVPLPSALIAAGRRAITSLEPDAIRTSTAATPAPTVTVTATPAASAVPAPPSTSNPEALPSPAVSDVAARTTSVFDKPMLGGGGATNVIWILIALGGLAGVGFSAARQMKERS